MQAVINESVVIGDVEVELSSGNTRLMLVNGAEVEYDVTAELHTNNEILVVNVAEPGQASHPEQAEQPEREHAEQPPSSSSSCQRTKAFT